MIKLLIIYKQLSQCQCKYINENKRTRELLSMNHHNYLRNGDECITNVECSETCCKEKRCVKNAKMMLHLYT